MKNLILNFLFLSFSIATFAQKDLNFSFQHLVGTDPFSSEVSFTNNLGDEIQASVIKYYLSEFTIIHDGGQETQVEDLFLLVNAEGNSEVNLSGLDFTELEALRFYIGVPEDLNHADPALQPAGHPLAYQTPSMHWGWAGGYKFLVTEGDSGTGSDNFQIHATGDGNYTAVNIDLNLSAANASGVSFSIVADYMQLYKDISMENGLFNHGEFAESQDAVNNLATNVFTVDNIILDTKAQVFKGSYTLAPNPSTTGSINLSAKLVDFDSYTMKLINMLGQSVETFSFDSDRIDYNFNALKKGIFFVEVSNSTGVLFTEKIIIQ